MIRSLIRILIIVCGIVGYCISQDVQVTEVPTTFSSTTIVGMAQDDIGHIWMATNNQGLYKYNGDSYTLFNHQNNNPNSLISDRLECIHIAKNGKIWIGSFSSGLSIFDPSTNRFDNYVHDPDDPTSIRANAIRRFAEDANGGIWVATNAGIDYWNPESKNFERDFIESDDATTLSKEHIRSLIIDQSGVVWAGGSSPFYGERSEGGLYRIDPSNMTVKRYGSSTSNNSLSSDIVSALYEDSRGTRWVGTAGDG